MKCAKLYFNININSFNYDCNYKIKLYEKLRDAKSILSSLLRNHNDFDSEMELFQFNHTINKDIETILLFPSANNLFLSSSSIKEALNSLL